MAIASEYAVVLRHAVELDAGDLRDIAAALSDFTGEATECKVDFADDSRHVIETNPIDEKHELWDLPVRKIRFSSYKYDEPARSAQLTIDAAPDSRGVVCDIAGPSPDAKEFRDKIRSMLGRSKPIYSALANFYLGAFVASATGFGALIGIGASLIAIEFMGVPLSDDFPVGSSFFVGLAWRLIPLVAILVAWRRAFPKCIIKIGVGNRQARTASALRTILFVGFGVGVLASIAAPQIWPS